MIFPDSSVAIASATEGSLRSPSGPAGPAYQLPTDAGRATFRARLVGGACIGGLVLASCGLYFYLIAPSRPEPATIVREFMLKNTHDPSAIEFVRIDPPVPLRNAVIWTGGEGDGNLPTNERPWETFREDGWAVAVSYRMAERSGATRLREVTYLLNSTGEVFRTIVGHDRLEAITDSPNLLLVEQTAQGELSSSGLHADSIE